MWCQAKGRLGRAGLPVSRPVEIQLGPGGFAQGLPDVKAGLRPAPSEARAGPDQELVKPGPPGNPRPGYETKQHGPTVAVGPWVLRAEMS